VRVKEENKEYIETQAEKEGVSASAFADYIIDCYKESHASKRRRS